MDDIDKIERKLKKVKIGLMRNPKFAEFAPLMMLGKTSIDDNLPTAYTNGRDEHYGRGFIAQLSEKEVGFVILHETLHKAFRHLFVWQALWKIDPELANRSCDYVINLILVNLDPNETFIAMPQKGGKPYGFLDRRFVGMNSKQVFDILREEKAQGGGECDGSGEGGEGGEGAGSGEGGGFDEHDWEGAKELSSEEVKELEKEIDQALRQGQIARAKLQGEGAGNMTRALGDLLAPQLDWKELLREFINAVCTTRDASSWRRVNRRYLCMDTYMPSMVGEKIGDIVVGVDTSGSIGNDELNKFLSEIKAITDNVNPEKLELYYWDSTAYDPEVYDASNMDSLVQSTKPKGGGGTNPCSLMERLNKENKKPQCIIMLTDGVVGGEWGDRWSAPMLWVISNSYKKDIVAGTGKTIYINN